MQQRYDILTAKVTPLRSVLLLTKMFAFLGRNVPPHCTTHTKHAVRHLNMRALAEETDLHKITVPQRMMDKIASMKARKEIERRRKQSMRSGTVVISCKRPLFNHYQGQTYTDFKPQHLASGGWKSRKKKMDYFTINAVRGNPALKLPENITSFGDLGIHAPLVNRLNECGISKPTSIQASTIPLMLQNKNIMCAAETGSGKTLAYLLPVLQKLDIFKRTYAKHLVPETNCPHCLIVTPSRELADQIFAVTQDLCGAVSLQAKLAVGGRGTQKVLRAREQHPMDILISTTGILSKLLTNRIYDVSRVQHVILDEADTLLDDSFSPLTKRLISNIKVSSERVDTVSEGGEEVVGTQLALVSATMPRDMDNILADLVPMNTIEKVTSSHLHHVMPHVAQKFIKVTGKDKPNLLVAHLKTNVERKVSTIVFVNKASTACFISYILDENKIDNILLHAGMSEKVRQGRFEAFQNGTSPVLVCTDIASRGLDTCLAQHVINYEFPDFVSDYIHRVGRVGRIGSHKAGFALNFIQHRWEVDLVWKIESAVRRNQELHNVNANIRRKIEGEYERRTQKEINILEM